MSEKDLDNLFKNKLEEFGKAPSRDLWADIDKQLPQNKKKGGYWFMSIAASIIILIAIGLGFYLNDNTEVKIETIAKNEESTVKDLTQPVDEENDLIEELPVEKEVKKSDTNTIEKEESQPTKPSVKPLTTKSIPSTIHHEELVAEKTEEKKEEIPQEQMNEVIQLDQTENIAANEKIDATNEKEKASTNKQAGNTLTFDINDLGKKEVVASNNTEEEVKKQSKLKQLYNIAKDIKEGESGLSDLREAKNELFAMNFRKHEDGK